MGKQKQKTKTERTSPIQQARSELERDRVPKKKNAELSLSSAAKISLIRGRAYKKSDLPQRASVRAPMKASELKVNRSMRAQKLSVR